MRITNYFNANHIALNSSINDRDNLFELMVDMILNNPLNPISMDVKAKTLDILNEREKHNASNMGNGIFVPHARIEGIDFPAITIVTLDEKSKQQWLSKYKLDVRVFVMLIIPKDQPNLGLKIIAGIAELFEKTNILEQLSEFSSAEQAYSAMQEFVMSENRSLRLRNIMNRDIETLNQDMRLSEAVRLMHVKRYEAMPVIDSNGKIVGEINNDMLLSHGIPDFFKNLSTVSFIREFDPLEKYFANEAHLKCHECMHTEPCCMSQDSTVLESIFELSICGKRRIYVVDDNKLIGSVDRSTVLDKLLNI